MADDSFASENLPRAPSRLRLPGAATLVEGQTLVFPFLRRGYAVEGFLLHHAAGYSAFLNQCQHWPIPLDFGDGDFFHGDLNRIRCKTHGATYEPESGFCDAGPCHRSHLIRYAVEIEGNDVWVQLTEE